LIPVVCNIPIRSVDGLRRRESSPHEASAEPAKHSPPIAGFEACDRVADHVVSIRDHLALGGEVHREAEKPFSPLSVARRGDLCDGHGAHDRTKPRTREQLPPHRIMVGPQKMIDRIRL
jgi:hypothetical protein